MQAVAELRRCAPAQSLELLRVIGEAASTVRSLEALLPGEEEL